MHVIVELQRLKTKDEQGNIIQEPKEDSDTDTDILCRRRIIKIASLGGFTMLIKYTIYSNAFIF